MMGFNAPPQRTLHGYRTKAPETERHLSLARAMSMYGSALVVKDLMELAIKAQQKSAPVAAEIMKNDAMWVGATRNAMSPHHRAANKQLSNANRVMRRLSRLENTYESTARRAPRTMKTIHEHPVAQHQKAIMEHENVIAKAQRTAYYWAHVAKDDFMAAHFQNVADTHARDLARMKRRKLQ